MTKDGVRAQEKSVHIRYVSTIDDLGGAHRELMQRVFGDEWWHLDNDAPAPNPDWYYLERTHYLRGAMSTAPGTAAGGSMINLFWRLVAKQQVVA